MNLSKSTAIVHRAGSLSVAFCSFRGGTGSEKLYEGNAKRIEWICNKVSGGDNMASDAARLFAPKGAGR
jgi:hypothetical protein